MKLSKIMPKGKGGKAMDGIEDFMTALLVVVVLGFVTIVVAGNLETSTGFAAGSENQLRTAEVMGNVTDGMSTFFSNTGTWLTILSVGIIITIIAFAILKKIKNVSSN